MVTDPKLKAWDLFNNMFKPGDEVIVLDSDDYFHWGSMTWTDAKCILSNPRDGKQKELYWDDVRFVAHEGFPVRKLAGADGSKLIETLDTTDTQRFLREATTKCVCRECKEVIEQNHDNFYSVSAYGRNYECRKHRRAIIGDPYMLEDFCAKIINPGNFWNPEDHWSRWQWNYEEVMMLFHKGGATGLLWDIPTIYHFELGGD